MASCGKCKFCPQENIAKVIIKDKLNITKKKGTGNCKECEIIYAALFSKHKVLYIGHKGGQLTERFSKHRCDIKNRPDNSKLAKHFHESHNINDDLNYKTISKLLQHEGIIRTNGFVNYIKILAPHALT